MQTKEPTVQRSMQCSTCSMGSLFFFFSCLSQERIFRTKFQNLNAVREKNKPHEQNENELLLGKTEKEEEVLHEELLSSSCSNERVEI